jgi:hypothetical protein
MKRNYTQNQLLNRNKIIKTHPQFGNLLDGRLINVLINLFDEDDLTHNIKIKEYIKDERKNQGLNDSNVIIKSEAYRHDINEYSLILKIIKNGIEMVHLTIHLTPTTLAPELNGVIHFYKNTYKYKVSSRKRYKLYALISVKQPIHKQQSLEFAIANGYNTPSVTNATAYDSELQKEMKVIITVLNRLFNESNTEFYIGDQDKLYPLHKDIDRILNNINSHTQIVSRKNKGVKMMPKTGTNSGLIIYAKNKKFNKTRKHRPIINIESNIIQQNNNFNRVMPNSNQPMFYISYNKNKRKTQKVYKKNI